MSTYRLLVRYIKTRLSFRRIAILFIFGIFLLIVVPRVNKHGMGDSSRLHDGYEHKESHKEKRSAEVYSYTYTLI